MFSLFFLVLAFIYIRRKRKKEEGKKKEVSLNLDQSLYIRTVCPDYSERKRKGRKE